MRLSIPPLLKRKKLFYFLLIIILIIVVFYIIYLLIPDDKYEREEQTIWGVTFSKRLAQNMKLDWKDIYIRMLDDLNIKSVRIPAYWDEVEINKGEFDFNDLDWQIQEAKKRNVDIVLAIGYKLPRWPECRKPYWMEGDEEEMFTYLKKYLKAVVEKYKDESFIFAWQIENEPFFEFGICSHDLSNYYKEEVEYIKTLDNRPIITTDSGELSFWRKSSSSGADILGISTYRIVYNPYIGYFTWFFLSPEFYRKKTFFIDKKIEDVYLMELQAEPWTGKYITQYTLKEQLDVFDEKKLIDNLHFAKQMEMKRVYLWGVEWWYYLNDIYEYSQVLDTVKNFINE